jgi:capsule biosynthesis phosphatase
MEKSTFVIDVDGTICVAERIEGTDAFDYPNARPIDAVISRIRELKSGGHTIILHSARGMKTHNGDREKIELYVRPIMEAWLEKHEVPYDELVLGKPWGPNVFYVDDRALSPYVFAHYKRGYEDVLQTNILTL